MKKIISLVLTLVMLMTIAVPTAFAADTNTDELTPIIFLRGNGEPMYYEDGTLAPIDFADVLADPSIYDVKGMIGEVVNIIIPFLSKGLAKDDWDECRKAIYNAISPFFQQAISDGDGNAQLGTGLSRESIILNNSPELQYANYYQAGSLTFHYDWRRDPYDNVDLLHEFVLKILDLTGKSQVSFVTRCLGGTLLNAYLEKYGHLGLVKNAMYGDTLAMGSTVLSKLLSGKLEIDGKNLQRYKGQLERCAETGQGVGFSLPELLDEIIVSTLDVFTQTNVTDMLGDGFESIYNNLLQMLLPALLHAIGYGSTPNYYACVLEEDFDDAITFMFGEEGSEGREHFAGLIKKITYYREHVTSKLPTLYKETFTEKYGIHIGTISKYGYLNMPMFEDNDMLSDGLASLEHASFGATCAKVGETLSDSYIAQIVADENGRYISPDKQVDLSTSISPETAWVVKNCHHGFADIVFEIATPFCNGTNYTIDSEGAHPQFIMYDEMNKTWSEMTEDNCSDLEFMSRVEPEPTVMTKLAAGIRFLTVIINLFVKLLKGEINFDGFGAVIG